MSDPTLSLDPDGGDFILRKTVPGGNDATIRLSEADIMALAQSVPSILQTVLSRHQPTVGAGHTMVTATDVTQVGLNDDSLGQAILGTMIAPSGNQTVFAVPETIAQHLVDRLPVFLQRLRDTKQNQRHH